MRWIPALLVAPSVMAAPSQLSLPQSVLNAELYRAAAGNDVERVHVLLDRGANPNAEAPDGTTPLFACATHPDCLQVAKLLVEAKADVDHAAKNKSTPLHMAAKEGNGEFLAFLITRGAKVNLKDDNHRTPIRVLAEHEKPMVAIGLQALLKAGADASLRDGEGTTPLMQASQKGNIEAMELLIQAGNSVNECDRNGDTPLMYASREARAEAVAFLLARGAVPNTRNKAGLSVLMHLGYSRWHRDSGGRGESSQAPEFEGPKILSLLMQAGFDPKGTDARGNTELHKALEHRKWGVGLLQTLVDAGADPKAVNHAGYNLLMAWARNAPSADTLPFVAKWGFNPNEKDHQGLAPIHIYLSNNGGQHFGAFKAFLEQMKPEINQPDPQGSEPLAYAAGHSDGKHLELLLHAGAHVSHRDIDGDTAITEAILAGKSSLIPVLLRAGAKPEDAFRGDWDALTKAVKTGKAKESFAQLAEKDEHPRSGTDPGAIWTQGALVTAVLKGDLEFIQATEAAGVDLTVPWRKGTEPLQIALEFRNLGNKPDSFLDSGKPMVTFAEAWYRKRDESTLVRIDPSATQTDAGFYCHFSAQVTGSNAQEVKWSIEGNPKHASIDQEGVFRASQDGLYRVIAVSSKDPSLRGVAMVKVKNAIHEDAIADGIPKTHGGVSFAYLQDFQVLQIGGWSGKVPMDLVLQWKGDESAPIHAIGHLKEPRMRALCASLGNGKVLICDGMGQAKGTSTLLRSAEVFDVKRGTSESVPSAEGISTSTYYAHCGGIICPLKDGRILLLGGDDGNETCSGAELYDPTLNQFQRIDSSPFPVDASCVQLEDGRVLIFGGRYLKGRNKGPSREILSFDPEKRAFMSFGKLLTARYGQASTLSFNGKILISGGCVAGRWSSECKPTTDCELLDTFTGKSLKVGPMSEAKSYHAAAQIPTGQILTFGGLSMLGHSPLLCRTMEQFDPDSATWQIFNHPNTGVVDPVLYRLPGGNLFNGGSTVEFDPAKRDKGEDDVEPTPELCR